jgi:glutathione peroxidase
MEVRPVKTALLSAAALLVLAATLPATAPVAVAQSKSAAACPAFLNHEFRKLHSSQQVNLCKEFAGKPMLIVNTASHCGFTGQFAGLEAVHKKYKERGLVVVGFASNDFNQEAKDEAESAEICLQNFGVTFTMMAPQSVKGATAIPVFKELARQSSEPKWNFNKYLVTADGKVTKYFASGVAPESAEFIGAVESLLN